jgi:hypothetical protein
VSHHWTPHSWTNFDKTCQLTGTVRGTARRPHFSLAIISVTVQLWTWVFWVISAYFNIKNTLLKSGTFLLGHPVYRESSLMKGQVCNLKRNCSLVCREEPITIYYYLICDSNNLHGQAPVFISFKNRVAQLYLTGTGFPFYCLL